MNMNIGFRVPEIGSGILEIGIRLLKIGSRGVKNEPRRYGICVGPLYVDRHRRSHLVLTHVRGELRQRHMYIYVYA